MRLDGKVAIVTGANSGMGMATARALLSKGATVIMLCRDEKRGKEAFAELTKDGNRRTHLILCDLGDYDSIRAFASQVKERFDRLDILVNNAGFISLDRQETKEGLERQFGINHVGHFLLTTELLELMGEGSRIVVVASGAHKTGRIHFEDINLHRGFNVFTAYSQSKLANVLFTRELARRVADRGITVNCCHPGAVATNIGIDRETGFGKTITGLLKPFFQTPEQGARTAIFLATDESVKDISGEYFYKCRIARSSKRSKDMKLAKKLYTFTESLINKGCLSTEKNAMGRTTMGRNHEVTKIQPLLDSSGELREPGWSRKQVQKYDRSMIKAPKWRIKEWDYYMVLSDSFAGAFTISDDGYIGLQSVSLLDFGDEPWEHTETVLNAFPMGRINLPDSSSKGPTKYMDKRLKMKFDVGRGRRRIRCKFDNFCDGKPFECDILLEQPEMDSMVIATPWDKKHAFYYNQKINTMRASGYMKFDGKVYEFNPKTDFGTLDWGRGVWTYDNTWLWGSGNADIDGNSFGFNIGYGFGNTSAATENVIFYNGKVHKLDDIEFHIPENIMDKWTFTSSDGRFEMEFEPVLDRAACLDYKLIVSDQHQVFGRMTGRAVLDDGTAVEVKDIMCFAEKVHNRY